MNFTPGRPFDPNRAYIIPQDVAQPQPAVTVHLLADLIKQDVVQLGTPMLLMSIERRMVALITRQVVLLHVMQGKLFGRDWLVSFCSVCNSGSVFSPVIDDKLHTFTVGGMYNAMIFLTDHQTRSYWDHLTGVCIAGNYSGRRLARVSNLLHVTARQVLNMYPDAIALTAALSTDEHEQAADEDEWRQEAQPEWSDGLVRLLDKEDTRLPRLEMGLGVWSDSAQHYYPMQRIHAAGGALLHRFDGRGLLVYRMPHAIAPAALFTEAKEVRWQSGGLLLDDECVLRDDGLYRADGTIMPIEQPNQVYMRWFGFALKFPGCTLYGERR